MGLYVPVCRVIEPQKRKRLLLITLQGRRRFRLTDRIGGRLRFYREAGEDEEDATMNTANLQLEGLYIAVTALAEALREKGLLSAEELAASLDRAETVAWEAQSQKGLSTSNIEAVVFPIRYLRVAVEASARGNQLPFHEVARIVGEAKLPRPPGRASYVRRADEGGSRRERRTARELSEDEMLDLARAQEQERDA